MKIFDIIFLVIFLTGYLLKIILLLQYKNEEISIEKYILFIIYQGLIFYGYVMNWNFIILIVPIYTFLIMNKA